MAFTETFTGSADTDLVALGTGWTRVDGTAGWAAINASNGLKCTTSDTSGAAYTAPDCGTANHYAQAVINGSGNCFAACVRVVDRSNFIGGRVSGSTWELYKRVSGTLTLVGSSASGFTGGDVMKVEISGTSAALYKNGASQASGTVSDGAFTGITKVGLVPRSGAVNPWLDTWESTQSAGSPTSFPPIPMLLMPHLVM